LTPTDRALRMACQAIVVLWIAAFLGWRDLAPREVRVAVTATAIETRELPPAPEPEVPAADAPVEPEPEALAEEEPEPEELADEEPEPLAEEPETLAEAEPPPEPETLAEPAPEPPAALAAHEPELDAPLEAPPIPRPALPEREPQDFAEVEPSEPAMPEPDAERAAERARDLAPAPAVAEAPAPRAPEPLPPTSVGEADVAFGGTLLSDANAFPALESRYEGYGSFREYARAMQRLGARFVVVDRRAIVGTIDPWTLETGALGDPAGLSPRARDYAGEPELLRASRAVRRTHGRRAEVMMLVPRRLDAGLFGGIARALEARGHDPARYREIRARYERGPGGRLHLRVEAAVRRDGGEEPLPLLFDLDRLASGRV